MKQLLYVIALSNIIMMQAMNPSMDQEQAYAHTITDTNPLYRRVVAFDEQTHGAQALSIFYRAFGYRPNYLLPTKYKSKNANPNDNRMADVLLLHDEVIGVLLYYDTQEENKQITRILSQLAIAEKYRKHSAKHGTFMLKQFEEKSLSEGIGTIELISYKKTANFYTKNGYKQISQNCEMQKNLANDMVNT